MEELLESKAEELQIKFKFLKDEYQESDIMYDEYEYQEEDEDFAGILPERSLRRNLGCG